MNPKSSDAHALWHRESKPQFSFDPFLPALPEVPISTKVIVLNSRFSYEAGQNLMHPSKNPLSVEYNAF